MSSEANVKDESIIATRQVTRSAGVVSIAVMGSRVLGLVREMALAYFFRAEFGLDAFYAAFRIPNLLRDLFGEGILSKAFVTTFTDIDVKEGDDAAWRLASIVFNALAVVLSAITLLGILLSPIIVDSMLAGKGFDILLPSDLLCSIFPILTFFYPDAGFGIESKRELTVYLTRIMFPFILLVSLAAIAMGLLNSKDRFFIPASASAFFNLGSVVVGVSGCFVAPSLGQHPTVGMAVGVLVGGALQFLIQTPSMRRVGYRYRPILSFTDPGVLQVMKLVAPMTLGAAALQVNVFVNTYFASYGKGWLTWLNQAFRLIHLPIGVFGVAISTAILPVLSSYIAKGDMHSYRQTISHALRLMLLLTIPASVGLIVLKVPIVQLIYQRGVFSPRDTIQVAGAVFYYAFGLCGYSAVKIATDGFYALKDTRTPVFVSFCTIALNILLNYLFIFQLGFDHRALGLSTSCTLTLNFMLLFIILQKRVSAFNTRAIALTFFKVILASSAMGLCCWWISIQSADILGIGNILARIVQVGASIAGGILVFYIACRLLRVEEMNEAIRAVSAKFLRQRG